MNLPIDSVSDLLRELSASLVLPRFRNLAVGDIEEKSPGDLVTIVDREVEQALLPRLTALLPGSRVVGEEGVAANPALLSGLGQGLVWLVDPIDGTANFAAGREGFATMVALLREGETVASWIYAPLRDRLCVAELGAGARLNGEVLTMAQLSGRPGVVRSFFMPPEFKRAIAELPSDTVPFATGNGSAGIDYPALVQGHWRFLLYWRTLPWDHIPGSLLVQEAGGHVAQLDGGAYRAAEARPGLLAAPDRGIWQEVRALFPPG